MSKSTVLITGSNGFLGQKLTDLLSADSRYEVIATSKGENRNPNQADYTFRQLDILDTASLDNILQQYKPASIIHTAALTSVEACEEHPELCQRLNIDVVAQLGRYAALNNSYLVHLSTDFVFDGKNGPYKEHDPTNPLSSYGKSKVDSEKALALTQCKYAVLRTILVYGIIADEKGSNLVLWAKDKLSKQEAIKVVNDQWRMPTFVDDLARACKSAIEKQETGIFHISGEEMMTIADAVYTIADFWNFDRTYISEISADTIGQTANRPRKTGFDLSKAKHLLDYRPTPFRESLHLIDQQFKTFRPLNG